MDSARLRLFDAHNHAHLVATQAGDGEDAMHADLERIGLVAAVVNGTSESDWDDVAALAERRPWVRPAYGLHPWHVAGRSDRWQSRLAAFLDRPGACSVGEIGLDRAREDGPRGRKEQEEVFLAQIAMAVERGLPASIHCVRAWGRILTLLQDALPADARFLLHSYGGPAEMVPDFAEIGAWFSFSGAALDERRKKSTDAIAVVPSDRLLVETDAPNMLPPPAFRRWLLPDPCANHPANLRAIHEGFAALLGEPLDVFSGRIEANFAALFGEGGELDRADSGGPCSRDSGAMR